MRTGFGRSSGMSPMFGIVLFIVAFLFISHAAGAHCCSNWGAGCCNIFSCNCDGPCTNFGCNCPPVNVGGACGSCSGYSTCVSPSGDCGYCTDPAHCCNNGTQCCLQQAKASALNLNPVTKTQRGYSLPAATPMERFKAIDKDGNGSISMAEATEWLKKNLGDASLSDLQSAFKSMDKNKNGTIEPAEFDSELATGAAKPPK